MSGCVFHVDDSLPLGPGLLPIVPFMRLGGECRGWVSWVVVIVMIGDIRLNHLLQFRFVVFVFFRVQQHDDADLRERVAVDRVVPTPVLLARSWPLLRQSREPPTSPTVPAENVWLP